MSESRMIRVDALDLWQKGAGDDAERARCSGYFSEKHVFLFSARRPYSHPTHPLTARDHASRTCARDIMKGIMVRSVRQGMLRVRSAGLYGT